jgi:hypothetical protein
MSSMADKGPRMTDSAGPRAAANALADAAPGEPDTDVSHPWAGDNQAWWDWYVSLAYDDGPPEVRETLAPLPEIELPDDATVVRELRTPLTVEPEVRRAFAEQGFVKLRNVLSPGVVLRLRRELVRVLETLFDTRLDGGAADRFLSAEMVWLDDPLLREYVTSPRIAGICAQLLDVPAVRLYHDNVLSKEPGCGRTPWHYDDHHFPLATRDVVTAWIPAQAIPLAMGPLAFAGPIDVYRLVQDVPFSKSDTSYDRRVAELFRAHDVAVDESPFELGEVSFHHNLSFHTARGNHTDRSRVVLANTFYVDGATVVDAPTMVSGDWQKFMPGVGPGEIAASELNPVCWPVDARPTTEPGA